jgi:uncharacterized oxidoreductase
MFEPSPSPPSDWATASSDLMQRILPHDKLSRICSALFQATGATESEAWTAAQALVTSSLMGHDSHGVLRVPEYLGFIEEGTLVPGAVIDLERTGPGTAVVDCGQGFGAVGGKRAMRAAIDIARDERTACVVTRRSNHVGRLGAYVEMAAAEGMIALATCNSPISGHFVLPWGGREGRLATNPIAYGVPTGADPIVADFSTSVAPEGKIRLHRNQQKQLPTGWVLDAEGRSTTDAKAFYGPPRGGILPLGGSAGHKGFALGLLVEILGSALAGVRSTDQAGFGNGVCFVVIDPSAFCPLERFRELMDELVAYVKSSPPAPGFDEILVPGELEFRTRRRRLVEGIPVDEATWQAIVEHARRLELRWTHDG